MRSSGSARERTSGPRRGNQDHLCDPHTALLPGSRERDRVTGNCGNLEPDRRTGHPSESAPAPLLHQDTRSQEACNRVLSRELVVELNLVGSAPLFQRAMALMRRYATCDANVLVQGETGTGKELVARAIHHLGSRVDQPFVPVNCGAIQDSLIEDELFGHERGAFTDARVARQGLIAAAADGTLFLDELEALSPRGQVVLLRFLQDRRYRPIGSTREQHSPARVISASNVDLDELVRAGHFRADLMYRVRVLELRLPALRERREDISELAQTFISRLASDRGTTVPGLDSNFLAWMQQYHWPGNVRELESVIQRAWLLSDGGPLVRLSGQNTQETESTDLAGTTSTAADSVEAHGIASSSFSAARASALASFERRYLESLLAQTHGNLCQAARVARHDRGSLRRLLNRHGLTPADFRERN